jgi:hypothetical protein
MRNPVRLLYISLVLAATPGCRKDTPQPVVDTTAAGPTAALPASTDSLITEAAAGTLAMRSEAQAHFDRSRAALTQRDSKAVASELRGAARLFRSYADSVAGEMSRQVVETARELENTAREAEEGRLLTEAVLLRSFARANRVEAQRHHARAMAAWSAHDTVRTGEEMLMAVDHLERAVKDADVELDSAQRADLDRGRALGARMLNRSAPTANEVDRVMASVLTRITRMKARLASTES